jgi:hypothetical protein
MILRNAKIVKHSEDIMAESEDFSIDSQMDMSQNSDRKIDDSSQITKKEMSVNSANKEMLNLIHTMFSYLEEKLAESQNEFKKSQEKMGSNLEELKRARR